VGVFAWLGPMTGEIERAKAKVKEIKSIRWQFINCAPSKYIHPIKSDQKIESNYTRGGSGRGWQHAWAIAHICASL